MLRLALNGYGRIGRCVLRALYESGRRRQMQVVAINEPADLATIAHLTKYDSTHGRFPGAVSAGDAQLRIDDDVIAVSHQSGLEALPWAAQQVDMVLDCSGCYSQVDELRQHIEQGGQRVLLSQPGEADIATVVYGLNHGELAAQQRLASAASCTSNAIVPVIDALQRCFRVESGLITTIHSAMHDQPVIDAYHHTDLRKTRAAGQSIIPVDTGLASGIERVLPALAGRFAARALRVPTINVSAIELSVLLGQSASAAEVNACLASAAREHYTAVLGYSEEPLASCDFNHDARSGIVDASQTRVSGRQASVLVWFDNEWAYANRMLDIARHWAAQR